MNMSTTSMYYVVCYMRNNIIKEKKNSKPKIEFQKKKHKSTNQHRLYRYYNKMIALRIILSNFYGVYCFTYHANKTTIPKLQYNIYIYIPTISDEILFSVSFFFWFLFCLFVVLQHRVYKL